MKLILPFPPSVNTYWRHPNKGAFSGKSLISAAGRKFQSAACAAIVEQLRRLPKPTSAPASVEIVLFPPDNRIRDLDNYNKALFDALTHAGVWEDDSQVKRMLVEWGPVIQDAINAVPALPFTASSSAGVVTLTARHKGLCGNEIPVSLNYYGFGGGEVLPAGVQIAVETGTAGTGAPVLTGAVAAMADEPFDYIGLPFNDTASVNTLVTEMNDTSGRWSYARQLYGHVYTAKTGTLSELVTAGDQFNQQHITLAGYEKETQTPADELAASRTARAAVFIRNDPARPTQTGELVGMLPAPKGKRFTMTEQQTLLSHGVATAYVESGVLRIQRDVTTYRKNAYGVADNSYLDSETLHTSAYVLRKLKSVITSKYGRHKLASDGTRFGPGQAIVTPAVIKGELLATYRQLERAGIVENYELFKQYLVVERDASDPNRLNTLFPPDYVNQLRVFAVVNQFRLQYSEESA